MSYLTRDPSLRLLNGGIGPLESDTHYSQASGRLIHVTPELYNLSRGTAIKATIRFAYDPDTPEQSKVWPSITTIERPVKTQMSHYQVEGDMDGGWYRDAVHRALNDHVDTVLKTLSTQYTGITFVR